MTTTPEATSVAAVAGNVTNGARLPLAVVAAEVDGRMMCVMIDSFFDESLAPGLVSVRISLDNPSWEILRTAPTLGISVLNPVQGFTSGGVVEEISPEVLYCDPLGVGIVPDAAAHLTARLYQEFDAGTHAVALLHVIGRTTGEMSGTQRIYSRLAA